MFGGANMAGMMKKVQKMQSEMARMQEDLKSRVYESSVGGGAVTAVMSGERFLKSVKVSPAAVDPDDIETLEDLIVAAVNECLRKVEDDAARELGKLTGGLGLPPGMF
ncbi:MAG: YbaB/EbfC family nucleoid-associated protein [Negativicutes bacterium]|nr:YbaB/EbfC family nucleoid-associated protein [Negativicutes bacterium]